MIISHKFKCIFIRIPKTGSTSIETFLMQLDPNCISSDNTKSPYGHFTASEVREMVSQNIWETYFKFTFVREPLSWFKSQYADHMQYSHKTTSLGVNYLLLDKDQQIRKPSENCLGVDHVCTMFIILQRYFKHHSQKRFLDETLDYVGHLENIQDCMQHVTNILHIDRRFLIHTNKSKSTALSYTSDASSILKIILKEDIQMYKSIVT